MKKKFIYLIYQSDYRDEYLLVRRVFTNQKEAVKYARWFVEDYIKCAMNQPKIFRHLTLTEVRKYELTKEINLTDLEEVEEYVSEYLETSGYDTPYSKEHLCS